jgi:outer membrane receptor protein involved in Fe transport
LVGEDQDFTTDRFDYYPTLHISYALPSEQQVMASYTRRISRSHGYSLEPFLTWEDAHNVRIGNPSLKPEFIDSYELSYQKNFGRNTFSVDLYYRITNNKVERIRSNYETTDPQYADTLIYLNSIDNVGKDYSLGSEIMLGIDLTKWWHIDIMGNLYDYQEKGELLGESFDKSSFNWNSRLNNTFKVGKNTRIQLNGMYNSPTATAQGKSEGFLMTNLAAKQDFMNNKLSLTLQVRDLFHTSGHEMTSEGADFYSYRKFQPDGPVVSMTLTLKLNNYKPDRKRQQSENGMEEMDIEN